MKKMCSLKVIVDLKKKVNKLVSDKFEIIAYLITTPFLTGLPCSCDIMVSIFTITFRGRREGCQFKAMRLLLHSFPLVHKGRFSRFVFIICREARRKKDIMRINFMVNYKSTFIFKNILCSCRCNTSMIIL